MKKKDKKEVRPLKKINPTSEWTLGILLGKGSFGSVFLAKNNAGETYAAKVCEVKNQEELQDLKNEVEILSRCSHINILKAQASYFYDKKIWMILELCEGGALDDVIETMDGLDETTVKAVTYQSMKGLEYLHGQAIIHRDIKAGNIMLCDNGILKLADFGVSAILSHARELRNTFIGTPYWMAPEAVAVEAIVGSKYGSKVDIWSMAITVLECVEVLPPNSDYSPIQVLLVCTKAPPPTAKEPEKWSNEMNDFLTKTLIKDPSRRPDATACLEHPWLACEEARNKDLILELYKLSKAMNNDADFEVIVDEDESCQVDIYLDDGTFDKKTNGDISNENGYPSFMRKTPPQETVTRRPTKTIRKTVRCEVNGITRVKSVIKVVGEDNKGVKERAKSIQLQIINQLKVLKLEAQREQKKMDQAHKHYFQEVSSKYNDELEVLHEKYRSESEAFNKLMTKEMEKKKNAYKTECEKNVKKIRLANEKEKKLYVKASKQNNKGKYHPNYSNPNFISDLQTSSFNNFMSNLQGIKAELVKINLNLVRQKSDQLIGLLSNVVMTKMNQSLELAQIQRSQIGAQLELALQYKLKTDTKEQTITAKYMSDRKEQLNQQHTRIVKDLPKVQRAHLKKALENYKKSIRQQKLKNEKELMQKRQDEIISQLAAESKSLKETNEYDIKKLDEEQETQLRDIKQYQETKSKAVHTMYQELLYERFIKDEKIFKNLLKEMHKLKKERDDEYEKELETSKKVELEFIINYTKEDF